MSAYRTRQIDRDTAERLLRGVPATLRASGPLGEHLAAAAAPAHRHELAGWPAALSAFQAAHLVPATEQRRPSMIKTLLAKMLTIKAAALLAVTAAGGVALAATTGALPSPLTHASAAPDSAHATTAPTNGPSHRGGPSTLPSPSLVGLCHAYIAGAGSDHGKALESPAFTALITAAGGKDKVADFCKATLASAAPSKATTDPSAASHPTGAPTGTHPTSSHPAVTPTPSHPGH